MVGPAQPNLRTGSAGFRFRIMSDLTANSRCQERFAKPFRLLPGQSFGGTDNLLRLARFRHGTDLLAKAVVCRHGSEVPVLYH
jgi:hypothetical protein